MGLDASTESGVELWRGAYSAFTRWRNQLAEAAGYTVAPGPGPYRIPGPALDWDNLTEANGAGDWETTPADPLLVLLAHSDCDGHILPAQAGPLADRLTELLPLLPAGTGGGHIGDWRVTTQTFIDGLRAAAEAGERVEFY